MSEVIFAVVLGALFRLSLFYSNLSPLLQTRVEISTPLNSWIHVLEGLYLSKRGISPYKGDTFHETPLMLELADILTNFDPRYACFVFVLCDIAAALLLGSAIKTATGRYLSRGEKKAKEKNIEEKKDIFVDEKCGNMVVMAYMMNPYTILTCVGQATTTFGNLMLALTIFGMLEGRRMLFGVALALAVYQSLYPVSLLFPAVICFYDLDKIKYPGCTWLKSGLKTFLAFAIPLIYFIIISARLSGSWDFLNSTYGFILLVRDLKPNIGLFWYFFTEMFEHFHLLFICTFQINAFIYIIPLTIRFLDEPPLLIYSFCALMTIFKSYPSIGDVGFYLSLIPMWRHLFAFMQQKFLFGCFLVSTTVLAPIQWFLWMYSGSANANFYFGVTIAFGTAQIFLLTDVFLAYIKREYYLQHGKDKKEINGKPAILTLI